jgi:fructose-1,6-bisphosphatase I
MPRAVTLSQFIIEQQRRYPTASGEFTQLLLDIGLAAKIINREVTRAGLVDILGYTGSENVHGEKVQKLDAFAHETIYRALMLTGQLAVMASEEDEDLIPIPPDVPPGHYVLNFDPLDGSSNINANINIGTIFSVLRRVTRGGPGQLEDVLQPGCRQVCAGYVMYGSSTMLVYTTGNGVHGFTFEPSVGEFLLSHREIRMPERGRIYSVNEGNYARWDDGVKRYVDYLKESDEKTGRPYSLRYVGSLVADFHRNLMYGGVFLYPADRKNLRGKLRLLYECAPLALIAEQAGGAASDGHQRVLDITPVKLHERSPLVVGSQRDVAEAEEFVQGRHPAVTRERRTRL